jgi:hypothetical protein
MRAGLTRRDPGMMVLLAPWKVWLTFILTMWGIAAAFLPPCLMVASLVINAGVGIWLGATEHHFLYASTAVMGVALWTWWSFRSWQHARAHIGDQYLLQTGQGGVYADFLTANFTDDHTRDRAVRLWHPELQDVQTVVPGRSPGTAVELSTTGP